MGIKTDSTPVEEPKDPDACNLFALFQLFASDEERDEMAQRYRKGGVGYGEVKKRLLALMLEHFKEARMRREEIERHPDLVEEALKKGAEKAHENAAAVMSAVRNAVGV